MYVFRFPLVFGRRRVGGIAHGDDIQRNDVRRDLQYFPYGGGSLHVGICARPYGSQSEAVGGQQHVFGGSRYVLHPELSRLSLQRLAHVAACHDGKGSLCRHLGIGQAVGQRLQKSLVLYDYKGSRLLVYRRGSGHAGSQDFLDVGFFHRLVGETADAGARGNALQNRLLGTVRSTPAASGTERGDACK